MNSKVGIVNRCRRCAPGRRTRPYGDRRPSPGRTRPSRRASPPAARNTSRGGDGTSTPSLGIVGADQRGGAGHAEPSPPASHGDRDLRAATDVPKSGGAPAGHERHHVVAGHRVRHHARRSRRWTARARRAAIELTTASPCSSPSRLAHVVQDRASHRSSRRSRLGVPVGPMTDEVLAANQGSTTLTRPGA